MKRILISDTHYGIKQNSITWLNSQTNFIYKELIPYIKSLKKFNEEVKLYHLGDVFDSRSSINPFIAENVRKAYIDINKALYDVYPSSNSKMFIIGGNHDYYSPNDDEVNSSILILHKERDFNPTLIVDEILVYEGDMFVPWYEFDKIDKMEEKIERYKSVCPIKNIFCHADLLHLDDKHKEFFNKHKNIQVFSGHIHSPHKDGNLITLGSTYALTFADCNDSRGFYVLDDRRVLDYFAAKNIIKFWRFKNEDIFNIDEVKIKNDMVELYIDKLNLLDDRYNARIKELTNKIHNIVVIPNADERQINDSVEFSNYNIEEVCKKSIPKELKSKFKIICKESEKINR